MSGRGTRRTGAPPIASLGLALLLGIAGPVHAASAADPEPTTARPGTLFVAPDHPARVPAATASGTRPPVPADAAAGLSQTEAGVVFAVLADPAKRAQLEEILSSLSKAVAPATAAGAKAPDAAPPALVPDSLGVQLLAQVTRWFQDLAAQFRALGQAVGGTPLLLHWLVTRASTAGLERDTLDAAWRVAAVVGAALLAELLAARLLRAPLRRLGAQRPGGVAAPDIADPATLSDQGRGEAAASPVPRSPPPPQVPPGTRPAPAHGARATWQLLVRVPLALVRLLLELVPIGLFLGTANLLLSSGLVDLLSVRLVLVVLVNAFVVLRVVLCVTHMLVAPDAPGLRLIPMSDALAAYITGWVWRITLVGAFGTAAADIGSLLGLYPAAHDALIKLVALVDHVFLVIIVLQKRAAIATRLRAPKSASRTWAILSERFASVWHLVAIFYILAFWVVGAEGVQDGYLRLLRFFVVTLVVTVSARLLAIACLGAIDRGLAHGGGFAAHYPGLEARASSYRSLLRQVVGAVFVVATGIVLLQAWGLGAVGWLTSDPLGARVISALVTIGITIGLALLVWEGTNAMIGAQLGRLTRQAQMARAARIRTLLPMIRTILLMTIVTVVGLTMLSEIGVNIAPLLAGAGILGVAIGFGSQKLVQDFITGIFLLLENAMQVGDWITVAGLSGTVEALSIRTIRMRAGDGSVTIIPFSSVTTVNNTNRGIGNAAVTVSVGIHEDTDHVARVLAEIATEMRDDPAFKTKMLTELQFWGVDKVDATTVTLVGQIVCTDDGRWAVQREYIRRTKIRFAELGIAMANPSQAMVVSFPQQAGADAAEAMPVAAGDAPARTVLAPHPASALQGVAESG